MHFSHRRHLPLAGVIRVKTMQLVFNSLKHLAVLHIQSHKALGVLMGIRVPHHGNQRTAEIQSGETLGPHPVQRIGSLSLLKLMARTRRTLGLLGKN